MDDPLRQIPGVIATLVQGSPGEQRSAIETYFTRDASFTHPFCRTLSFDWRFLCSRDLVIRIYRWYRILSPSDSFKINSLAYDEDALFLYVNISQVFAVWFIPWYRASVTLTTMLRLRWDPSGRRIWRIAAQEDLYQIDQFAEFLLPWGVGSAVVILWHLVATVLSVAGAVMFAPLLLLQRGHRDRKTGGRLIGITRQK